jgi:hypothetical protein
VLVHNQDVWSIGISSLFLNLVEDIKNREVLNN